MGIEGGNGAGTYLAYAVIAGFVVLLVAVVLRTILLYSVLLILPVGRVLRWMPGVPALLARFEARVAAGGEWTAGRNG
ncbi:MAG: hypothetical protein Q8K82_22220 [Gemmatimonadaceae bacterium]|nr:hypothetical protein [Gemmatimonadaceae bacterium]